ALERVPSALDDRHRVRFVPDLAEFVDVRTGDEPVRLARNDREAFGWIAVELIERLVELLQHFARQRVRRRAGLVEREAREPLRVAGEDRVAPLDALDAHCAAEAAAHP